MKAYLNDSAVVTLSEYGAQVMRVYYENLGRSDLLRKMHPDLAPGMKLKTQLWCLSEIFGGSISVGSPAPFVAEIEIIPC